MDMSDIPISEALVKALDKAFPAASPRLTDSKRMIWFKAGQRAVVEMLLKIWKEQSNVPHPEAEDP